ncbi:LysR family transcriptional regulator [Methylobacterium marchantiae]|uniref:LysR family transcriptional regulator n=1 Tax=Methylobacterium marchantiae TaxID=600331 RepID=A0ABW3X417_9HYPH|nr:HTH-type transcriptional regulator PgrR [Methylobacterium marchantiae]
MQRADLSDLAAFASVATHRRFRKAAVELGVSPSALSHALRGLEARIGVRLLHRTTRSVAVTEAGAILLARLHPALAEIAGAVDATRLFRDEVTGSLRINAPGAACRLVLMPLLARFLARHPGVAVEISGDNAMTDVVAEGFDAGIRMGERVAKDMIALPIGGQQRFAVIGSPAYLDRHGVPRSPQDLALHACIRQRFPSGRLFDWKFEKDGRTCDVPVAGSLTFGDQELMVEAASQGIGLAFVFEGYAAEALAQGRVVRLMEDWCPPFPGFHLCYSGRRHVPSALKAFIDLTREGQFRNDGSDEA